MQVTMLLDKDYCDLRRVGGGLAGYYPPVKGSRPEILFDLYKPFDNMTTSRRHD